MNKPLVYALWITSVSGFAAVAGAMLGWRYLCDKIDDAFDVW